MFWVGFVLSWIGSIFFFLYISLAFSASVWLGRYKVRGFGKFLSSYNVVFIKTRSNSFGNLWENPSLVDSLTRRQLALAQVIKDLFWQLHVSFKIFFLNCLRFTFIHIVLWPLVTEFEIQKDLCDSFVQASRLSLVSVELSACQHSCSWFMPSCSAEGLVWGRIKACCKSGTWVEQDS